jgi:hypothetical protein
MPCLNQKFPMLPDQPLDLIYFMIGESEVLGKLNRVQPELGDAPIVFHMDVDGLTTIRAEEHEAVRADPNPHFSSHLKMWRAIAAERRFFVATVRRRGSGA